MCGPRPLTPNVVELATLRNIQLERALKQKEEARKKHLDDIETVNQNARGK